MMKKIMFLAVISALFLAPVASGEAQASSGTTAAYDPSITYHGHYDTTIIYYSITKGEYWKQLRKLDSFYYITCPQAVDQLKRYGVWKGALNDDGSCLASDEPADWAMGNWLNYRDSTRSGGR